MPIDREQLYLDTVDWLPPNYTLSEAKIRTINATVIARVGDEEMYYAEILCKSLNGVATAELALANVGNRGGIKRLKEGVSEREYFDSGHNAAEGWRNYILSLANVCPLFGYTPTRPRGIVIDTGGEYDPLVDRSARQLIDFYK